MKSSTVRKTLISALALLVTANLFLGGVTRVKAASVPAPNNNANDKNITLQGDLLANNDSQTAKAYKLKEDENLNITATLNVKPIKDKLSSIEKNTKVPENLLSQISVSNLNFQMTAKLTLPNELDIDKEGVSDLKTIANLNSNDKFAVTEVTVNGKELAVVMKLKDQDKQPNPYGTYLAVKEAVQGAPETLSLTLTKPIKLNKQAKHNEKYTLTGTVTGEFKAQASLGNNTLPFQFKFTSQQDPNGKDSTAETNAKDITFTVGVPYDASYEFVSGTSGKSLPSNLPACPADEYDIAYLTLPKDYSTTFSDVQVEDGTWKFAGWQVTFKDNGDKKYIGTWNFTEEKPEPEPEPEIEYVPSAPKPTEVKMQVAKTGEIATTVSSLGLVTLLAAVAYLAKKH